GGVSDEPLLLRSAGGSRRHWWPPIQEPTTRLLPVLLRDGQDSETRLPVASGTRGTGILVASGQACRAGTVHRRGLEPQCRRASLLPDRRRGLAQHREARGTGRTRPGVFLEARRERPRSLRRLWFDADRRRADRTQ